MKRPWQIWVQFAICVLLVLAAMARVSFMTLELDREQIRAKRRAQEEERIRLALWRIDSALIPLIGRESARPQRDYSPFSAARQAYTRRFSRIEVGDVLVPSPVLMGTPPHILLHFQFDAAGRLTSPQVPTGNMRDLAEAHYTTPARIQVFAGRLARLRHLLDRETVLAQLQVPPPSGPQPHGPAVAATRGHRQDVERQQQMSSAEWRQRKTNVLKAVPQYDVAESQRAPAGGAQGAARATDKVRSLTRPILADDLLFLVRKSGLGERAALQGCWLDWRNMKAGLLRSLRDLLPNADLVLAGRGREGGNPFGKVWSLATIEDVQLVPGKMPLPARLSLSPIEIALIFAWVCMLTAAAAAGVLLHGTIALSERRAAFVSAVTHELRTPLTTFRMYTEMLAGRMVPDEEKRSRYLTILQREANRLGHLVENVLAYASLERGRHGGQIETVLLRQLLGRVADRLEQRTAQAQMTLAMDETDRMDGVAVRADVAAVEQILFNLVDNACKYAASASDRTIHFEAREDGARVALRVRDHGPGIAPDEHNKLFKPFTKSASDAARSAPGVGLGLSLSRRLARTMGGDLRLDRRVTDGACFVLCLPRVEAAAVAGAAPRDRGC